MKFRKKSVVIEAFQLGIDYIPDWFMDKFTSNDIILHGTSSGFEHHNDLNADIQTLEGVMHANFGDFIIKGVEGEIYPCKPKIFDKTYELVSNTNFDKIKAMSVEEFVAWVLHDKNEITHRYANSFIGLKEWLESEVQEE